MNEIVLHVGSHKTGSTSIQKTLDCFRENLFNEGVKLYEGSNHIEFYRGFSDNLPSFHRYYRSWHKNTDQSFVRDQIRHFFAKNKGYVHVVSAEDICLLSQGTLKELRAFLLEDCAFDKVSIVCFLREPLDYLNSSLQQYLKPGMTSLNDILDDSFMNYRLQGCPDFAGGVENILRQIYFPIPEKLIGAFGFENVTFHKFEDAIKEGLTRVFLGSFLSERHFKWLEEKVLNESLCHEACLLLAEYNDRNPLFYDNCELNEKRAKNKKIVSVLRKIEGRSPALLNIDQIDIGYVNMVVCQINTLTNRQLMAPIENLPARYENNDFFMFSGEALKNIAKLVGSRKLTWPLERRTLSVEELRTVNGLIERKCCGRGTLWSTLFE